MAKIDKEFINWMYEKLNKVYDELNNIMGDVYRGNLSYEGLPNALDYLKKRVLFIIHESKGNSVLEEKITKVLEPFRFYYKRF